MPANVVRTAEQERLWNKAKAQAEKQGRGGDYAYIMGIFKRMGGMEKSMGLLIGNEMRPLGEDDLNKAQVESEPDDLERMYEFEDTELRKAYLGSAMPGTEDWAGRFSPYRDLYVQALQCIKDRMKLEKDENEARKQEPSWSEMEELPKSERMAARKARDKRRERFDERHDAIRSTMADLEAQLIDKRIEEAKAMNKSDTPIIEADTAGLDALGEILEKATPIGGITPGGYKRVTKDKYVKVTKEQQAAHAAKEKEKLPKTSEGEVDLLALLMQVDTPEEQAAYKEANKPVNLGAQLKQMRASGAKAEDLAEVMNDVAAGSKIKLQVEETLHSERGPERYKTHDVTVRKQKNGQWTFELSGEGKKYKPDWSPEAKSADDMASWLIRGKGFSTTPTTYEPVTERPLVRSMEAPMHGLEALGGILEKADKPKGKAPDFKTWIMGIANKKEMSKAQAGPFIGPKGGKWADPEHKVPWDEKRAQAGKKQKTAKEHDEPMAEELELTIVNESQLHNQMVSIRKNLINKMAAGNYDHAQAAKLWNYAVENGAKLYKKEWGVTIDPATRMAVARSLSDQFFDEAMEGEYGHLMNKKNQKALEGLNAEDFKKLATGKATASELRDAKQGGMKLREEKTEKSFSGLDQLGDFLEKADDGKPGKSLGETSTDELKATLAKLKPTDPGAEKRIAAIRAELKKRGGMEKGMEKMKGKDEEHPKGCKCEECMKKACGSKMHKSEGLDALAKAIGKDESGGKKPPQKMPTGNPPGTMPTSSGTETNTPQEGGPVEGVGTTSGPNKQPPSHQQRIGNPTPDRTDVLSADDAAAARYVETGFMGEGMKKSDMEQRQAFTKQELEAMSARDRAQAVALLRKGEADLVLQNHKPHPFSHAAFHGHTDEDVERLDKSEFYSGVSPQAAPVRAVASQEVMCKSCSSVHSAMLTACPECGDNCTAPGIDNGHRGSVVLEKSIHVPYMTPRRDEDLKIG